MAELRTLCIKPLESMEKYPHTFRVDWKLSSCKPLLVGLKPASVFSSVICTAMQCPWGGTRSATKKSMIDFPEDTSDPSSKRSLPYSSHFLGM